MDARKRCAVASSTSSSSPPSPWKVYLSVASNYAPVNSINRVGIRRLEKKFSRPPNRELRSRAMTACDVATSSVTRRLINFLCNSILRQSSGWRWRFVAVPLPLPPPLPLTFSSRAPERNGQRGFSPPWYRGFNKDPPMRKFSRRKTAEESTADPLFVEVDHVPPC